MLFPPAIKRSVLAPWRSDQGVDVPTAVASGEQDYSLILGGPLFQILRRAHLSDGALALAKQRVVVLSLLAWLPLLVLSVVQGKAFKGSVAVPFLLDLDLHVRFLVALPLLVAAEVVVHRRMSTVVRLFRERGIIPESEMPRFNAAVESSLRLRNSVPAELLLLAFVYGFGVQVLWRNFMALNTASWYATPTAAGTSLTFAGIWYGYVSLPLFQFLLIRWYFRIFIWGRFLFRVSKLELSLMPPHPDRVGGLGFLGNISYAFAPLAAAHGALTAGAIANRIFYTGARLVEFKAEIALLLVVMLFLTFGPLLVFAPRLAEAKRRGMREYGTLAERYVREFDAKWLHGGAPPEEPLLGSADIQSLADLTNSVEVVRTMSSVPISKEAVLRLALATLAPIVPLALTMMPLEQLVKTLFGLLF